MKTNRIVGSIILIVIVAALAYWAVSARPEEVPPEEYIGYKDSEYSPAFSYPKSWGQPTLVEGNETCPDEDTYRTPDTLSVYEWEYTFPEKILSDSESFFRSGIRTHEIDPADLNDCGDVFLNTLAGGQTDSRTISSVRLEPASTASGLSGIYNTEASRLNTESRRQYTFFAPTLAGHLAIQVYVSFIPVFGSPELAELESNFAGNMAAYIESGKTANPIRERFDQLQIVAKSIDFSGE